MLPPRPRPGYGSPSDLPARGWERGERQSRHIPVRPAACPAAASIASTACGSAGLHRRRAPSLGRHPPGLRPPGPTHYACAAPPPGQSLRRRESHWARPRLQIRPTLAPAVPRLRPDPLTLPLCPRTQVFSWRELFTPVTWLTSNGLLDSNVPLDHDQTCQLPLQTNRSDLNTGASLTSHSTFCFSLSVAMHQPYILNVSRDCDKTLRAEN